MSRLETCFARCKAQNKKVLATYIVSGDPEPGITLSALNTLVESGADVIEVGIPFSDPMAEGPVIQKGHERALAHRVSLTSTLAAVKSFRQTNTDTPIVLMGYANPIERMGYATFVKAASEAGVDGVLTVDLPPEEAVELDGLLKQEGIDTIYLLAPTSSDARIQMVAQLASGFVYYVSLKGVTGAGHLDAESVSTNMARIRKACNVPVMIGFGIKDASSTKAVAGFGEGVVVGSALVNLMGQGDDREVVLAALAQKVTEIRNALDG